jgi:hypothetical protein
MTCAYGKVGEIRQVGGKEGMGASVVSGNNFRKNDVNTYVKVRGLKPIPKTKNDFDTHVKVRGPKPGIICRAGSYVEQRDLTSPKSGLVGGCGAVWVLHKCDPALLPEHATHFTPCHSAVHVAGVSLNRAPYPCLAWVCFIPGNDFQGQ